MKSNHIYFLQGLQEATSELINKLTTAAEDRKGNADLGVRQNIESGTTNIRSAVGFTSEAFDFEYTFKVIMYNHWYVFKVNKIAFENSILECLSLAIFM